MSEPTKHLLDGLSVMAAVIGLFFTWLPSLATLASFIWMCIRIYETKTVGRWVGREDDDA